MCAVVRVCTLVPTVDFKIMCFIIHNCKLCKVLYACFVFSQMDLRETAIFCLVGDGKNPIVLIVMGREMSMQIELTIHNTFHIYILRNGQWEMDILCTGNGSVNDELHDLLATKMHHHHHHFASHPFTSKILFHCSFASCFVVFVWPRKKMRNEFSPTILFKKHTTIFKFAVCGAIKRREKSITRYLVSKMGFKVLEIMANFNY